MSMWGGIVHVATWVHALQHHSVVCHRCRTVAKQHLRVRALQVGLPLPMQRGRQNTSTLTRVAPRSGYGRRAWHVPS